MARDRTLTGAQKAAVFILHMGKDHSAEVLRSMRETEVAEIARSEGRSITPLCGYARTWIRRHKEYSDLLT